LKLNVLGLFLMKISYSYSFKMKIEIYAVDNAFYFLKIFQGREVPVLSFERFILSYR
jgi:hypothetical protein